MLQPGEEEAQGEQSAPGTSTAHQSLADTLTHQHEDHLIGAAQQ